MYTNNRDAYRQAFFTAWEKHQHQRPLLPIEAALIHIIRMHPEYQAMLEKPKTFQTQEFAPEENPFIHMSLHQAIADQLKTNRPAGICNLYQKLIAKLGDQHLAEHYMMECLAKIIWEAQQSGASPDETKYLERLEVIIK